MMGWLADCDQETNIQQYALGPTVSKTHLPYAIANYHLSITFATFDVFVCIFMRLCVHVDLIQPLAARNNKRCLFVIGAIAWKWKRLNMKLVIIISWMFWYEPWWVNCLFVCSRTASGRQQCRDALFCRTSADAATGSHYARFLTVRCYSYAMVVLQGRQFWEQGVSLIYHTEPTTKKWKTEKLTVKTISSEV